MLSNLFLWIINLILRPFVLGMWSDNNGGGNVITNRDCTKYRNLGEKTWHDWDNNPGYVRVYNEYLEVKDSSSVNFTTLIYFLKGEVMNPISTFFKSIFNKIGAFLAPYKMEITIATVMIVVLSILGAIVNRNVSEATIQTVGVYSAIIWGLAHLSNLVIFLVLKKKNFLNTGLGCLNSIVGYVGIIMAVALSFGSLVVAICTVAIFGLIFYDVAKSEKPKPSTTNEPVSTEEAMTEEELVKFMADQVLAESAPSKAKSMIIFIMNMILNVIIRSLPFIVYAINN
jgi:hypothetical protein